MHIVVVSINYRTTPIELREKLSFEEDNLREAMRVLQKQEEISENVIISTCNRTEVYAVLPNFEKGLHCLKQFLAQWFELSLEQFEDHLLIYQEDQAIRHLLRVSSGIDSMVVGETQILGQVRRNFFRGQAEGTTSTIFNRLFQEAIAFSKKVHAKTSIGEHAVSISYAAVQLLKEEVTDLQNQQVLVLGAGEMGALTLKHLKSNGVRKITLINRTYERAVEMAEDHQIEAAPMDSLTEILSTATVVVSSTAARQAVIQAEHLQGVMENRQDKPLYIVDIAVPRDVDAGVAEIPSVRLYDIDAIQQIVDANLVEREKAAEEIVQEIDTQVTVLNEWLARLQVVPTITALEEKGKDIQQTTSMSLLNKIPHLNDREKEIVQQHMQSIVNQLIRAPIQEVKALALQPENEWDLETFARTFNIEQQIEHDQEKYEIAKLAQERLTK